MHIKSILFILAALLLSGCGSNLDRAKKAYAQGEYAKAEQILEAMMRTNPTAEVETYLNICKATIQEVENQDLVQKNWDAALTKTGYLLQYGLLPVEANQDHAQALYGKLDRFSLDLIDCWKDVLRIDPKNERGLAAMQALEEVKAPYTAAFAAYQQALLGEDFFRWKSYLSLDCIQTMDQNLQRAIDAGNKEFRSLSEYFTKVMVPEALYTYPPSGAILAAFEEQGPNTATLYFTIPKWERCSRLEATKTGTRIRFSCEGSSDLKNPFIK
jgi:hypothetical protein